jgi:hypothetical protein
MVALQLCNLLKLLLLRQRIRRSLRERMLLRLISTHVKPSMLDTYQVVILPPKPALSPSQNQIEWASHFLSGKHGEQV